jgi:LacI family transcriptional regulator
MIVTMNDVARRAKVSQATVSKCLRGVPSIPASTRERVTKIAQQLGYRPHPFISALMRNRRKRSGALPQRTTLGFLTAHPTPDGWRSTTSPFFRLLFAGAQAAAEGRGYALAPFWLYQDDMTHQRLSEMLRARGVRGLLINTLPTLGTRLELDWSYFSVVAHGLSLAEPIFHRTSNDHFQSMMLAMQECFARGYRRPGFVLDAASSKRLEYRWEAAYHIAREKLGFTARAAPLLSATEWDSDEVVRWIRREKPDVVIALLMEEQVAELTERGVRIPEQVGVVSLSVHRKGGPLSGIYQNPRLMGTVAADKLIDLVERGESGVPADPITLTVEGGWNAGRTVRRIG